MMYLKQTFDKEFCQLMHNLIARYPDIAELEGLGSKLDMCVFSKDFFSASTTADASIDANANVTDTSNIAYQIELPKPFFKLNSYYMLWKQLRKDTLPATADRLIELQFLGDIYINDFHGIAGGSPYCFNYSTYDIMLLGLPMVDKIKSGPPQYLYSFKSQLEQFVVIAANSTLGATGLADVLVIMSYYVKTILTTLRDGHFAFASRGDAEAYIRETLVSLIYTLNQPMRGNQSPFTNISIYDENFLDKLCGDYLFPNGTRPDKATIKWLQETFVDVMNREMERTPITFPVTTACFTTAEDTNEILDKAFASYISEVNTKFGFINIYCGKASTLSSCCRLRSETDNEYFNSFGAGSSKIGSLGVVTINLPRIAAKMYDKDAAVGQLRGLIAACAAINQAKRNIIKKRIDDGNLPLYTHGFMELSKQYSTIGLTGIHEFCEMLDVDLLTSEGEAWLIQVLDLMNKEIGYYQNFYGVPHNCEQIPAENSAVKLAHKDAILGLNTDYPLYSNQFIPLTSRADVLDRIRLQGAFDAHFTGGAICHINVEARLDSKQHLELLELCAKQGVVYFAVNYNLQECQRGHMSVGFGDTCSVCGGKIVGNYTRVVGFLTNTKNWNPVRRKHDYPLRKFEPTIQVKV